MYAGASGAAACLIAALPFTRRHPRKGARAPPAPPRPAHRHGGDSLFGLARSPCGCGWRGRSARAGTGRASCPRCCSSWRRCNCSADMASLSVFFAWLTWLTGLAAVWLLWRPASSAFFKSAKGCGRRRRRRFRALNSYCVIASRGEDAARLDRGADRPDGVHLGCPGNRPRRDLPGNPAQLRAQRQRRHARHRHDGKHDAGGRSHRHSLLARWNEPLIAIRCSPRAIAARRQASGLEHEQSGHR